MTESENALMDDGLVSITGAAAFLSLSKSMVWKLMQSHQLPWTNVGRSRRIPRAALKALALRGLKSGPAVP